jgi:hypothetical protein
MKEEEVFDWNEGFPQGFIGQRKSSGRGQVGGFLELVTFLFVLCVKCCMCGRRNV